MIILKNTIYSRINKAGGGGGGGFTNTKSVLFDGMDDTIDIGTTSLGITTAISVSAWVKTTSTGVLRVICSEDQTGGTNRNWNLLLGSNNKVGVFLWHTDNSLTILYRATANEINDGNWHHVLFTFDGTTNAGGLKLYVDGNVETATAGSTGIRSTALIEPAIGSLSNAVDWFWSGNIDEVSIWDSAISIGDVWDDSEIPTNLTGKTNLVSWWRMGDKVTSFPTIPDQVGSNDGTAYNENEATMIVADVPT